MRIERIGEATLYCADCLEVLPTIGPVDAVVTDPPYGIGVDTDNSRFSGGTAGNIAKRGNGIGPAGGVPLTGDDKPFDPSVLLEHGEHQIIWGWNHFPDKLPRGTCLIWIKRHEEAFGTFLSDAETGWMSKGHGVYCKRDLSNNAIARERSHPTQKPVSLMKWCLDFLPDAQTILDPFMGSGTTGVACANLGRRFIGIEIEPRYFDIACRRIRDAYAQPRLPLEEPVRVRQQELEDA